MNDGLNMDGNSLLFPIEFAEEDEGSRRNKKDKRLFLVGGPMGSLYPMGMFPVDGVQDEDDVDPNP